MEKKTVLVRSEDCSAVDFSSKWCRYRGYVPQKCLKIAALFIPMVFAPLKLPAVLKIKLVRSLLWFPLNQVNNIMGLLLNTTPRRTCWVSSHNLSLNCWFMAGRFDFSLRVLWSNVRWNLFLWRLLNLGSYLKNAKLVSLHFFFLKKKKMGQTIGWFIALRPTMAALIPYSDVAWGSIPKGWGSKLSGILHESPEGSPTICRRSD